MAFHRRKPSILDSVPAEILREIVSSVDASKDKAAVARTSKLLNAIAIPVLYRHISLDRVVKALGCLGTLLNKPERQDYVRSFKIVISTHGGAYLPVDMIFPLESVLRTLRNLEHLHLRIPDWSPRYLIIFATLALPNLRTFSSPHTGLFPPILSSFLNRHTALTHLDLIRPWQAVDVQRVPLLHFPRLRVFRGCSVYARALIVYHRILERVELWDAPPLTDLPALFAVLADATKPNTPFTFTLLWDGPQISVFAPLAQFLPNTVALTIGPFIDPSHPLTPKSIQEIAEAFASLHGLTFFDFDSHSVAEGTTMQHQGYGLGADFAALTVWSAMCPTLVDSRLHGRSWARLGGKWVLAD
ncbi:hypothetical protein C8R44DRAFT_986896 [Mycena epipterygia]|nr:hypothetical protein C8R44DRAFT_986896 [Mycena epipterygia]